uniref:Putative GPI inositol deacylase n=1 Tax=Trypanosoma congolense (strain IL3000) TaxID=1068625 RepID=G0UW69_TRYCI|nr:putative GPI inositol deacylase precursor [Trypanosoma congolense IL3000]
MVFPTLFLLGFQESFMCRTYLLCAFSLAALLIVQPSISNWPVGEAFFTPQPQPLQLGPDGWDCVLCTAITGIVSQLSQMHRIPARDALALFCGFFRSVESALCRTASLILIEGALKLIDEGRSADKVCQAISYCVKEECHIFPPDNNKSVTLHEMRKAYNLENIRPLGACKLVPGLCQLWRSGSERDKDGDGFSTYPTRRGTDWKGRDCDDNDPNVYPGKNSTDATRDENCNGIYGVDPATGKTYEELWCANSSPMGVIGVGDSATAHFTVPVAYVSVFDISSEALASFVPMIDNELDWPMLSSLTGFRSTSGYFPNFEGPMVSVYGKLLERNRCNHRDYQNIGHNGAASGNLLDFLKQVVRNRNESVKPAYVFFSMIGNDVCIPPPNFFTPEHYYQSVSDAVKEADNFLPRGSYVIIVPIADARLVIESVVDRIHPIGKLNNDVTYGNLYDYLNCLKASPCWGWLNSNPAVRNEAWRNASAMNAMIPRIVNESANLKNIKVFALTDPVSWALENFDGPLWRLVDPVDGFHPSQIATALIGERIFAQLQSLGILTPENPFNADIQRRFGDQGGY